MNLDVEYFVVATVSSAVAGIRYREGPQATPRSSSQIKASSSPAMCEEEEANFILLQQTSCFLSVVH